MAVDVEQVRTKPTVAERVAIDQACRTLIDCKQIDRGHVPDLGWRRGHAE